MVEVLVGALLLAMTTFAVLDGLEGAQATGQQNKQRSVSATLAQQDIERLRAFPVTALSNYEETRPVNVAGVSYTVNSTSEWIRDGTGVVSCTNDTAQAEYMKLTSTVHSPASEDRPVREVSLLTPAPGAFSSTAGTAAVLLTDRDGNPHAGVQVSLSGPGTYSDTTNSVGCAIFGMIPAGNYQVAVPGLVGWGGEGFPAGQITVAAAKTSLKQLEVEAPGTLRAVFETPPGLPATPAWTTSALSSSITVANAKLPGGFKQFSAGSPQTSIDSTGLFPFLDGYGVYAGTCRANNPAFWQADYYQVAGKGFAQLEPSDFLKPVPVQMGGLRVRVHNSSGVGINNARVTIRRGDTGDSRPGCAVNTLVFNLNTGTSGVLDFVLPFGIWRVCASGLVSSTTRNRVSTATGTLAHPRLTPPSGLTRDFTLQLTSSQPSGACSTSAT